MFVNIPSSFYRSTLVSHNPSRWNNSKSGTSSLQGKETIDNQLLQVQLFVVPQLYPAVPSTKSRKKMQKNVEKNKIAL
ncbi:hypothetical protein B8T70_09140 [Flavobacterium sp. AJR]|nr:hypothetical protein B8T70_09140 [Flavobacterium sp. AJR]